MAEDIENENDELEENDELFEHHRLIAEKGQKPLRVDKFLTNLLRNVTRNKVQQAIDAGNVHVNQQIVKANYKVKPDDIVQVVLAYPPRETELLPEAIPLDIVHQDEDVVVLNKQAGLVVHPGVGNYTGTLVNGLLHHFENLPGNAQERPGLVHRLDKETSGIMVVAASERALAHLARQFFDRTSRRTYWALVWGNVKDDTGTVTGNIGRSPQNRKTFQVYPDGEYGKHAVTHYKVLERLGYVTLLECKLETGRTHQIRVHLKYIGHTLFNDKMYGGDKILKGTTFTKYRQFVQNCFAVCPRQALHAKTLGFKHPGNGEEKDFDSELPQDMAQLVDRWRNYSIHSKELQ